MTDCNIPLRFRLPYARYMLSNIRGVRGKTLLQLRNLLKNGKLKRYPTRNCLLCQNDTFLCIAQFDQYGIPVDQLVCKKCSLIQASPVFDNSSLTVFYERYYRSLKENKRGSTIIRQRLVRQIRAGNRILKKIEQYLDKASKPQLVEIGCGAGGIVKVLRDSGFDTIGYDIDPTLLKYGRDELGLPLFQEHFKTNLEAYDGIILRHVLEHIPDPRELLDRIFQSLKPGGIFYVEVPGIRAIGKGKYDYNLLRYFVIEHVFVFEKRTLLQLIEPYGFELLEGDESITAIFKKCKEPLRSADYEGPKELLNVLRIAEADYFKNYLPKRLINGKIFLQRVAKFIARRTLGKSL